MKCPFFKLSSDFLINSHKLKHEVTRNSLLIISAPSIVFLNGVLVQSSDQPSEIP